MQDDKERRMANVAVSLLLTNGYNTILAPKLITTSRGVRWTLTTEGGGEIVVSVRIRFAHFINLFDA